MNPPGSKSPLREIRNGASSASRGVLGNVPRLFWRPDGRQRARSCDDVEAHRRSGKGREDRTALGEAAGDPVGDTAPTYPTHLAASWRSVVIVSHLSAKLSAASRRRAVGDDLFDVWVDDEGVHLDLVI